MTDSLPLLIDIVRATDCDWLDTRFDSDTNPTDIAQQVYADIRAEVLTEAADELDRIADTFEAGGGPGPAQMLRDAAGNVRYMARKDTREGESTEAAPDFFQPGHGYTHRDGTDFLTVAVTTHPNTGERRALGWIVRNGWHNIAALDPDDWTQYDGYEPPAAPLPAALAAYVAAGTCTCRAFPTGAHRADLHNENGLVRDIVPVASGAWGALVHAHCTRCGWKSRQKWLHEEFPQSPAQTYIAGHRDHLTGKCTAEDGRR